jgi:hypothetical protein
MFTITTLEERAIESDSNSAPSNGIPSHKKTGVPIANPMAT